MGCMWCGSLYIENIFVDTLKADFEAPRNPVIK
jgi:hypothetical protein